MQEFLKIINILHDNRNKLIITEISNFSILTDDCGINSFDLTDSQL